MHYLKFSSCLADPDVWMRPAEKSDGTTYDGYVLLYVDDALVISENAEEILREEIGKYFELKEESIGCPSLYLGGRVHQVKLDNGVNAWSFSSSQYIQTAVKNVEEWLSKRGDGRWKLPSKAETPMQSRYQPELDISPELSTEESSYFQSFDWCIEVDSGIGQIDICLEVSMMSPHLELPSVATHRSAASLSYAMGLISHYGQQGHNRKEEVIKTKN